MPFTAPVVAVRAWAAAAGALRTIATHTPAVSTRRNRAPTARQTSIRTGSFEPTTFVGDPHLHKVPGGRLVTSLSRRADSPLTAFRDLSIAGSRVPVSGTANIAECSATPVTLRCPASGDRIAKSGRHRGHGRMGHVRHVEVARNMKREVR